MSQCLMASMGVTFIFGSIFFTLGVLMTFCQDIIVEDFLDPLVKKFNMTKLLINKYESIVPTKDDLPMTLYLGGWTSIISYGVLVLGMAMLAFSAYGSFAARYLALVPLSVLIAMLLVTITGQYLLATNIMYLTSALHSNTRDHLLQVLLKYYEAGAKTNNSFTFFLNSIMLMADCCGINGPEDFHAINLTFVYSQEGIEGLIYVPLDFPPACCKTEYIQQGFLSTLSCATSKDRNNTNEHGCYEVLFEKVIRRRKGPIMVLISIIISWELLQTILASVLIVRPKPEEIEARKQALQAARLSKQYEMLSNHPSLGKSEYTVFVPHASMPNTPYYRGTLMTEIW